MTQTFTKAIYSPLQKRPSRATPGGRARRFRQLLAAGSPRATGYPEAMVCVRLWTVKMRDLLMTILSFHSGASICICLGIPRCGVGLVLVSAS